ncbi:hypothetical protein FACS1894120_2310 [Clostridia bacterium]|nr:hypothetical protein FACS1894120_2310 [Clostridia bacterium]
MNFIVLLSEGAAAADGAAEGGGLLGAFGTILPLIMIFGIFYLFFIRPERNKEKESRAMIQKLQVADEIVTIGGIIGRVLAVQGDAVLIETGGDRTRIRILKTAIQENRTAKEAAAKAKAEAKPTTLKAKMVQAAAEKQKSKKKQKY